MKVAIVIERMDTALGGREMSTAQIAQAFQARGINVTILCQESRWVCPGVEVVALGRGRSRWVRMRNFVADVQEYLARNPHEIVHAMLPLPGANIYQPRGGTLRGQLDASRRKRVAWKRPFAELGWHLKAVRRQGLVMERRMLKGGKVLCLCVSQMVADEFHRHYGLSRNVRVIYNAVQVPQTGASRRHAWRKQLREQLQVAEHDVVFVCMAKNLALKGAGQAIEAFGRWRQSQPDGRGGKLVFVGQRRLGDEFHRQARRLGLAKSVEFLPHADDPFPWYSAADVCVLLSWYDPCSRVVLEAIRWGLPYITTGHNGASELLGGRGGAVVKSPDDIDAVVTAMRELSDAHRRKHCAQACLGAAGELTMEKHVEGLVQAYQELAVGRKA